MTIILQIVTGSVIIWVWVTRHQTVPFWKWKELSLLSHPPAPPPLRLLRRTEDRITAESSARGHGEGKSASSATLYVFMQKSGGKRSWHDAVRRLLWTLIRKFLQKYFCILWMLLLFSLLVVSLWYQRVMIWTSMDLMLSMYLYSIPPKIYVWIGSSPQELVVMAGISSLADDKAVSVRVCACVCRHQVHKVKSGLDSFTGWGSNM